MRRSPDELMSILDRWRPRKIVVVGDFMLDRYIYGNAQRLSPDAPVPVLAVEQQKTQPGGAANVCLDLLALRCQVSCLGVVGRDDTGRQLRRSLAQAGCQVTGLLACDDERPTTVKHNFVGLAQHRHPQKMFRVDEESRLPIPAATTARLLAAARKLLRGAAVLCLEDYDKGVLTPALCQALIRLARQRRIPVLVDPAAISDYRKYRGSSCITPNRIEAALATATPHAATTRPDILNRVARTLLTDLRLQSVVLTLDKQGALLLERGHAPLLVPTEARAVYDVTGAGDMVLAMLAGALANGADWPAAVQLANAAAGLEVEKFGTVPIPLGEVMLAVLRQKHGTLGKIRALDQLLPELEAHRAQGKKIVFTNGCFDMLHAGHVSLLRQARQAGDLLVVAVNSDRSIRKLKGPDRPVNRQDDRLLVLSELQSIDYLVVFDQDTPIKLIQAVRPHVLVKGADYSKDKVVGGNWVEKHGGKIVLVRVVKGRSTTNIIRKIARNQHAGVRS
ncbi:MAG: D-glycero-beta-D-manno-heptose 1-phosphate adenylyltransferase [Phycisphaeraceae bacterium]|nr:D-glycero-beta-D-manno-heptose 1-phosphate adenylyltransferase [Phycisphaeraceae bacterium]